MSQRTYTTVALDCDGPACFEVYSDTVECSGEAIERFAVRDGWTCEGEKHYCPACRPDQNTSERRTAECQQAT